MNFHLGKPILVMLLIALVAGALTSVRPTPPKADLTLWVFAEQHYNVYKTIVDRFRQRTGVSVDVKLISSQAMDLSISSLLLSDPKSPQLPDLAEIEIGWVGKYFRPPVDQIGFVPLNGMLKESGWYDKIVKQRLAPWTKGETIFGVPHDVHPVTISYRQDLYREAGIDLSAAKTWPQFHEKLLEFEAYWRKRGYQQRHAMQLAPSDTALVQMILLQRHINLVDQYSQVHINDPKVAQTIAFYAQMVTGPRQVGGQTSGGQGAETKDFTDGNLCAFPSADWRVTYIKKYVPEASGKMRMMPLPKFDPDDAPTTTWGGTMIGITKACRRPNDAWKLIEFLYLSDEGLEARRQKSDILPPVMSMWGEPRYHQPDPYFGGQKSGEMFIELGRQVPLRYQTPASTIAATSLQYVLNNALAYVDEHGGDDGRLQEACQKWLDDAAADLQRRIAHWKFE